MKTKICTKCGIEKPINEFHRDKDKKHGVRNWCKNPCMILYSKVYRNQNREQINLNSIEYYREHRIEMNKRSKIYQVKHKGEIALQRKNHYEENRKLILDKKKLQYIETRDVKLIYQKQYFQDNKESQNKYRRGKYNNNPGHRLGIRMKNAICQSLNGNKNGHHWESLVNYTLYDLKKYLEVQFTEGMTWDNYGEWHIDHKIPVSIFNITSVKCKGFKKCWELNNLQPLWAKDNLRKNNKLFY